MTGVMTKPKYRLSPTYDIDLVIQVWEGGEFCFLSSEDEKAVAAQAARWRVVLVDLAKGYVYFDVEGD